MTDQHSGTIHVGWNPSYVPAENRPALRFGLVLDEMVPPLPRPVLNITCAVELPEALDHTPGPEDVPTTFTYTYPNPDADRLGTTIPLSLSPLTPGAPCWVANRNSDAQGFRSDIAAYFPQGIPTSEQDVDVVVVVGGESYEMTARCPAVAGAVGPEDTQYVSWWPSVTPALDDLRRDLTPPS